MKIEDKQVYEYISELEPYCQLCGSTNYLQRHHIFYRSQGGLTIKENLIVLCDRCHKLVHSNKKYWQDILIKKNLIKNRIDFDGFANYGVIYPTFIYPVMKRPFFGDFSVRIYGDFDVNINENYDTPVYSVINRNMLNNELLKIAFIILIDASTRTCSKFIELIIIFLI